MITSEIEKALNQQINAELESFYVYLSMVAYMESINLLGFASWMRLQAEEEMVHAMKIYDFVHERDGRVSLESIPKPPSEWKDATEVFQSAYRQEEEITEKINVIVDMALRVSDHATHTFMQWFVTEQVEELATVNAIIQKLKLIEGAPGGLFLLDQEMSKRAPGETE